MSEDFDVYLSQPETKAELVEMRGEGSLLLSNNANEFCRQVVQLGRLPSAAYAIAFAVRDSETGEWVKPTHPLYAANKLMRNPEVINYIKELRAEVVEFGNVERVELVNVLKQLAMDEAGKASDRIAAVSQLNRMEGFNKEAEVPSLQGATLIFNLPFSPQPLVSAPSVKLAPALDVVDVVDKVDNLL